MDTKDNTDLVGSVGQPESEHRAVQEVHRKSAQGDTDSPIDTPIGEDTLPEVGTLGMSVDMGPEW